MIRKPIITKELVELFKELFPNRLPTNLETTPAQLAYLQGQQSVINRIEFLYEDDQPDEI